MQSPDNIKLVSIKLVFNDQRLCILQDMLNVSNDGHLSSQSLKRACTGERTQNESILLLDPNFCQSQSPLTRNWVNLTLHARVT